MAVFFKNCTVEVALPEGEADRQPSTTRVVHLQPMAADTAYEQYDVQAKNPYLLMDEPEAASLYALHGRVTCDDMEFAIVSIPRIWNVIPTAAHIEVILSQIRTAETTTEPTLAPR